MGTARPKGVTVVAWILIVFGVLIFLFMPKTIELSRSLQLQQGNSTPFNRIVIMQVVTGLVYLVAGPMMLKGKNWSRLLYIASTAILIVIALFTDGFSLSSLPSIILYVIFVVVLTRPSASGFFKAV